MTDREKIVYDILCSEEQPPEGQHWEGFVASKIAAALAHSELGVTLTIAKHPVSLGIPSEYRLSKESLEDVVLEREWVGLTDDDLDFWGGELGLGELGKGVLRAVDAHLRENNGG